MPPPPPTLTSTRQPFIWFGMELLLPEQWNMTAHRGDATRGLLAFADLRTVRLELRWQTPKNCPKHLQSLLAKLTRAGAIAKPMASAQRVEISGKTLALAAGSHRVFELHWTDSHDFDLAAAETLVQSLTARDADPRWPWSVYGAAGEIHRAAKLASVSLLPGATRLEFRRRRHRTILGNWSMAERLLRDATLRAWATRAIPLAKHHPTGHWEETPDQAVFTLEARRLFGRIRHVLTLTHDRPANQIHWTQRSGPPTNREDPC